jgi:prepilin-type N-terminal cleavage/methylation domain-containing protein
MRKGVTFVELMVVIGVLAVVFAIAVPSFIFFQKGSSLDNDAEQIINILRLARSKTLASEDSGQYGVYFQPPGQFTLFKGADYSSRDVSYDKIYNISSGIEIYDASVEFVFERITGFVNEPGHVSLRIVSDPSKTKTIYVEGLGDISLNPPSLSSGSKIEDSRHVHFGYSRVIDKAAESIIVSVQGGSSQDIPIADYSAGGQFVWEGTIDDQQIKIQTIRLNNPDTVICVHRDRRYNDKGLSISLSGDSSGPLAEYSTDGSVLTESIYVTSTEIQ